MNLEASLMYKDDTDTTNLLSISYQTISTFSKHVYLLVNFIQLFIFKNVNKNYKRSKFYSISKLHHSNKVN